MIKVTVFCHISQRETYPDVQPRGNAIPNIPGSGEKAVSPYYFSYLMPRTHDVHS